MDLILLATDFSERSDLALARAARIAARSDARLHLVHVVDDDKKQPIIDSETAAARRLLDEDADRLNRDGVQCTVDVVLGDPFEGIVAAADALRPDLVVLGAHRRRLLRDVFVGTTAQRTIRRARWPVLMVNAPPGGDYARVLFATDLSETSRRAAARLAALDLAAPHAVTLLHVFDAPAQQLLMRSAIATPDMNRYLGALQAEADHALAEFADGLGVGGPTRIARHQETGIFATILDTAAATLADLVVVSSQGRANLQKTFLGSVAEEVLRRADRDVLVIPPAPTG